MRILRVLRIIRLLRFLRELLILIQGIAGARRALVWAMLLIFLALCCLSILSTRVIGRREYVSDP